LLFFFILLFSLLCSFSVSAATEPNFAELSKNQSWLNLVYYRQSFFSAHRWLSEADDKNFFLSEIGQTSPEAEFKATYQKQLIEKDQSIICRFPARYTLLHQLLGKPIDDRIELCTDFVKWRQKLAAKGASIIFPTAYLDSPSSMFGHTLLRLDQSSEIDTTGQLSYTFSYAAQMPESGSELAFVYRGLVGGYPGEISNPPYYLKLKEYRDIESRDIFEYTLNLNQSEIDQLVRHIWEVKPIRFDYFFFDENCSYRVMALLDAIKPNRGLLNASRMYTIPVVTVKDAMASGIVKDWSYRPSVKTTFNHLVSQLNSDQKDWVKTYVQGDIAPLKEALSKKNIDINTIEVAYQYSRMTPEKNSKQKSYALLLAKNQSKEAPSLLPVKRPIKRDDQGHESEKFDVSLGQTKDTHYIELGLRPAYHALSDPRLGFPLGSELIFASGVLRIDEESHTQLRELTVVGIKSYKSVTPFFNPTSWAVSIGADRLNANPSDRFTPKLKGQAGKALSLTNDLLLYSLLGGAFSIDSQLEKNNDVIALLDVGFLYRGTTFRTVFNTQVRDSMNYGDHQIINTKAEFLYLLNPAVDLKLNIGKTWFENNQLTDVSFGIHYFF
jgi:Domain of unknown function (DUF4105)